MLYLIFGKFWVRTDNGWVSQQKATLVPKIRLGKNAYKICNLVKLVNFKTDAFIHDIQSRHLSLMLSHNEGDAEITLALHDMIIFLNVIFSVLQQQWETASESTVLYISTTHAQFHTYWVEHTNTLSVVIMLH